MILLLLGLETSIVQKHKGCLLEMLERVSEMSYVFRARDEWENT